MIDPWPTDEDMSEACDPDPRRDGGLGPGCGHTLGQHEYGDDMAPCLVPGCPCRTFR